MPLKKKIYIAVFLAVLALLVVYGLAPKPVSVETAKAQSAPLRVTIDEEGKTRVTDRFVVSAPVAGYLRRIGLKAGAIVEKGDAVAELEPLRSEVLDPRSRAAAEAEVSAAEAAVKAADENARARQAEDEFARKELQRAKELFDSGYVTKSAFDETQSRARQTEANLLSARASVRAARSELQKARASLGYSPAERVAGASGRVVKVEAPVSGRILRVHRESEGAVGTGEPLIDIGNTGLLEIRSEVLSSDTVSLRPGMQVVIERWGGNKPLEGKVRTIEPAAFTKVSSLGVEEQRVLVIVDITTAPELWQGLGDGYKVETRFVTWEDDKVLQVPSSALFRKGSDDALFVVEGGRAVERIVRIGHRNGLAAEVLSGLKEGEEVIIHPDDAIRDGSKIKVVSK